MDSVERIPIPTPFSVGRVNCYLLTGNGLTLVDPGPATTEAHDALGESLADHGYTFEAIERILITHPHMDHFGLAEQIVAESGARVFAHEAAVERLVDPTGYFEREREYFEPFLLSMGVPADTTETVLDLPESFMDYQEPVSVTDELTDSDVIDVGTSLECVATPGHVPGSLCYLAASRDAVFTGDHVLPDVTPNPLLTLAPGSDSERTRSLPTYLESLETILGIEATVGYAGHGEPLPDVHARVRETISHHEDRKERIATVVAEQEPTTAYRIMKEMFPDLPVTELFSGMSEVIGHLDLLEDENRVAITEREGVKRYSRR